MRHFTLEEYRTMSVKFNSLDFFYQIKALIKHKDILQIGADGNWWAVKVRDKEVQEQLEDLDETFSFKNQEWGSREMYTLVSLLGLDITDA
jgi:hypothetical protein